MEQKWTEEVKRIRETTMLSIELFSCASRDWDETASEWEASGWEIICYTMQGERVWYVGIPRDQWTDTERKLLSLLLTQVEQARTDEDELQHWLAAVYAGEELPLPNKLETLMYGTEGRACFVIERVAEQKQPDLSLWQQVLGSFFGEQQRLTLAALSDKAYLLLVPLSLVPEIDPEEFAKTDCSDQPWLEWAASLHDLLAAEALEDVKIFVTPPLLHPRELASHLPECRRLSLALAYFSPRTIAAGSWQYPLERWAVSLAPEIVEALLTSLSLPAMIHLHEEQAELMEALCRHNLNISETSRSLYVHRNTLLYRLDKVKEQTGLDPRHFADAMLLRLATLFSKIAK